MQQLISTESPRKFKVMNLWSGIKIQTSENFNCECQISLVNPA